MKTQKLIVIVGIVCLLVGASGVAMAEDQDCSFGVINDEIVTGNVIVSGSCIIREATILGDIIADLDFNENLVVLNTEVTGRIRVRGGFTQLDRVSLPPRDDSSNKNRIVIVDASKTSYVRNAVVGGGNIVFRSDPGNPYVFLGQSAVLDGDVRCSNPTAGVERDNLILGKSTCPGL